MSHLLVMNRLVTLADLGGARNACPQSKVFHFHAVFGKKNWCPQSWIHHFLDFDRFLFLLSCEQLCDTLDDKVAEGQGESKVKGQRSFCSPCTNSSHDNFKCCVVVEFPQKWQRNVTRNGQYKYVYRRIIKIPQRTRIFKVDHCLKVHYAHVKLASPISGLGSKMWFSIVSCRNCKAIQQRSWARRRSEGIQK